MYLLTDTTQLHVSQLRHAHLILLLSLLGLFLLGFLLRAQLTLQRTVEGAGENTISPRTPDRERGRHHKSRVRAGKRYFLLSCCTSTPSSLTSAICLRSSSSSSSRLQCLPTYMCATPPRTYACANKTETPTVHCMTIDPSPHPINLLQKPTHKHNTHNNETII